MTVVATTRRLLAALTAAALGIGIVTGCGSEASEQSSGADARQAADLEERPASREESKSATPKPEQPDEPEELTFVKEYVEAINEVREGGDTRELLDLSTDDCESCDYMAQQHEDIYANGGGYIGDPIMRDVELLEGPEGSDPVLLRVSFEQDPELQVMTEKGDKAEPAGNDNQTTDFELIRKAGSWKVSEFCTMPKDHELGCPGL